MFFCMVTDFLIPVKSVHGCRGDEGQWTVDSCGVGSAKGPKTPPVICSFFANAQRPVAVPGVRLGDGAPALHTDRCHSLPSLFPPLAAVGSLPLKTRRQEDCADPWPPLMRGLDFCAAKRLGERTTTPQSRLLSVTAPLQGEPLEVVP